MIGYVTYWPSLGPLFCFTPTLAMQLQFACKSDTCTGLILGLCPANERRHYFVTMFLIGWVQA